MLLETDAAYLAGLIDGEGSIEIRQQSKGKERKIYEFCLRIRIGLKKGKEILVVLRDKTGMGSVRIDKKGIGYWSICSRQAEHILNLVLPYLRIEKRHAMMILEFYDKFDGVGNRFKMFNLLGELNYCGGGYLCKDGRYKFPKQIYGKELVSRR